MPKLKFIWEQEPDLTDRPQVKNADNSISKEDIIQKQNLLLKYEENIIVKGNPGQLNKSIEEYNLVKDSYNKDVDLYNKDIAAKKVAHETRYKNVFKNYKQLSGKGEATPLPKTFKEKITPKKIKSSEDLRTGLDLSMDTIEERRKREPELEKTLQYTKEVFSVDGGRKERIEKIYTDIGGKTLKDKKEAENIYLGLRDLGQRSSNEGLDRLSSIGNKGMVLLLGANVVALTITGTPKLWDKIINKKVKTKMTVAETRTLFDKVAQQKATTQEVSKFKTIVSQAEDMGKTLVQITKEGAQITKKVPRFGDMGSTLYGGLPVDKMVKTIVETGKIGADVAKELSMASPEQVSQVIQNLTIASPVIASKLTGELTKLIPQTESGTKWYHGGEAGIKDFAEGMVTKFKSEADEYAKSAKNGIIYEFEDKDIIPATAQDIEDQGNYENVGFIKPGSVGKELPKFDTPPIPEGGEPPAILKPTPDSKITNPIEKLNALLKQAKPLRGRLQTKYTEERAKRISKVEDILAKAGGEKGYAEALSKLKGELAPGKKVAFEPIKDKISQTDLDALYNQTFKHPFLDQWEKISAANELTKLFSGELPTPKGLVLLEEIYGSGLVKNILSKRALGLKFKDILIELANIPRALLTTGELSAFLRQGIVYVPSHPIIASKAIAKSLQFAFSPKAFEQYFKDIKKDPMYPMMRKSGLAITNPSTSLAYGREEAFMSRILQNTPILGTIIKIAERNYVGFLNKLRVDVFKVFADEFLSKGYSPIKDRDLFKATAEVVNTFTGRGSLGVNGNKIAPALNTVFFSSRLAMARLNALNPLWYANQPKPIRTKALKDFAKFVISGLTILAIAKAAGADVEIDPRSSDYGKIRIGKRRWDIWGGHQQWVRVFAQIITGQRKNTTTGEIVSLTKDKYPFSTRLTVALQFVTGKLAPVPSLVAELMDGAKTFEGEDMSLTRTAAENLIPLYIQDIADAYREEGLGAAISVGVPAFVGVGVQTYGEDPSPISSEIGGSNKLKFRGAGTNKSTKLKFIK